MIQALRKKLSQLRGQNVQFGVSFLRGQNQMIILMCRGGRNTLKWREDKKRVQTGRSLPSGAWLSFLVEETVSKFAIKKGCTKVFKALSPMWSGKQRGKSSPLCLLNLKSDQYHIISELRRCDCTSGSNGDGCSG